MPKRKDSQPLSPGEEGGWGEGVRGVKRNNEGRDKGVKKIINLVAGVGKKKDLHCQG